MRKKVNLYFGNFKLRKQVRPTQPVVDKAKVNGTVTVNLKMANNTQREPEGDNCLKKQHTVIFYFTKYLHQLHPLR